MRVETRRVRIHRAPRPRQAGGDGPMSLIAPFPWRGSVEVREDGSIWRISAGGRPCRPRRIDKPDGSKGYRNVVLPDDAGKWRTFKAHRLVWWWHHGAVPNGLQINHRNLVKSDNRLLNLEVVSASGNIRHSYQNGRAKPWSSTDTWRGRPIITDAQADQAREMRASGSQLKTIAAEFGISISHAHRLCRKGG